MSPVSLTRHQEITSLAAVYACMFANGLGMGLSLPLLSLLLEHEGVSATLNGANAMGSAVAMIAFTPFIPSLAARFGTVPFLIGCYAISAASLLLFRATDSLLLWFILRFALNGALQGLFVTSEVWINQIAPERMRGRLIAIYTSVFATGFGLGPMFIQYLGTRGWAPFVAGALTMLSAMVPLLIVPRALVPRIEHAAARAMFGFVFASPTAAAAAVCYGAIESCAAVFLAVYAIRLGAEETRATLLIATWSLGNMLLVPFIGWLADRTDRRRVLVACGLLCALAALALPLTHGIHAPALAVTFLWGGFISAIYAIGLAHLGASFRGSDLASANSAFAILYAAGAMSGPALGGLAMDVWNPQGLIVVLALIPAVFAGVTAWRTAAVPRPQGQLTSERD